jgi:predicted DNA-binding transcriptional regulator AlpA
MPALTLAQLRELPAVLDVAQAAEALGVSRSAAYESIRCGTFPATVITVGRRKRVLTSSLLRVLEDGEAVRPTTT